MSCLPWNWSLPLGLVGALTAAAPVTLTVDAEGPGKAISRDLVGAFFEDLSYAADGGLYAELVENRSFEYSAADREGWQALTSWELVEREGGRGVLFADTGDPLHPNNPHFAVLGVTPAGGRVGLSNDGFDRLVIRSGEGYRFSVFARQMASPGGPLEVRLEAADGRLLGEARTPPLTAGWARYEATIEATGSAEDARLLVLAGHPGRIALDMVSLFPVATFKGRRNGLRADLAQAIAELGPRFVRFPGGCLVHGDGVDNLYDWKKTIGPPEQRKAQRNIWHYHQTAGLGYFEYFQFCEDIGAKPLPVVAAGVSCQNSGASITGRYGEGQAAIPMEDMPGYVGDVLDLVEWANGPADSEWGSKRAAAGHPEPFGLTMIGVGNEDRITPAFEARFRMIHDALRQRHPEITVIGTVGPAPDDEDHRLGWELATELGVAMVDEHCYRPPGWFWENLDRWDHYDRRRSKVYLGEWAAHDEGKRNTLRSAIAEAAYLTSMERNGDLVVMSSYAPLLAKRGHVHWSPDLIYFDDTSFSPTINYQVQRLFSRHGGDRCLETRIAGLPEGRRLAASAVRDTASGDLIVKLVNGEAEGIRVTVEGLPEAGAAVTVLSGPDPGGAHPAGTGPASTVVPVGPDWRCELPGHSLTVIRVPGGS